MNIKELIIKLTSDLNNQEHAWWLLEAITNKTKSQLLFENIELTAEQLEKTDEWVSKIVNEHCPIQYLIGNVPFLNCKILVEPPILIPRSETEEWCADLISRLQTLQNKNISILDMCTGSGCIAIAIAKGLPEAKVTTIDISDKAIELTKKNIELNNVKNIEVIKSDLFKSLKNKKFDIIVSNPPYIDEALFETLDLSVKNWEDPNALIAKEGGLYLIKKIIQEAPKFLQINKEILPRYVLTESKHSGRTGQIPNLVIEIDETQGKQVAQLMQENGFINVEVKKDLQGKDRVVSGSL